MINRRTILSGTAAVMGAALTGMSAGVQAQASSGAAVMKRPAFTVPKGPWEKIGDVRRAGGMLHYAEISSHADAGKPPIVLLHKLSGWLSDWRFVAPALAEGRRVLAFDLPGHGGSRWDGAPPYVQTLGETAAALVGAFDELGLDKVDLVGTSLGGCASVQLCAGWPDRVRKLAIVSSALGGARPLAAMKAADDTKGGALDAQGFPQPIKPDVLRERFGVLDEWINDEFFESRKAATFWSRPSERGVGMTDLRGMLPRVTAPTLLLYGQRDNAYLRYRAEAEAALPHSVTKVVANSGAFVMMEKPDETARILRDWVQA